MSKKPTFSTVKEKKLFHAKRELEMEERQSDSSRTVQTTLVIEANLLYAVKEIALKRKQAGIKPDTVTGIIRDALKEIVSREGEAFNT